MKCDTQKISRAIENNLYDLFADIGCCRETELGRGRRMSCVSAGSGSWPHYVFRPELDDCRPIAALTEIKKSAGHGRVPGTLLVPDGFIDERLLAQVGISRSGQWAGMAFDLDRLPPAFPYTPGTRVETVVGEDDFSVWQALAETNLFDGQPLDAGRFKSLWQNRQAHYYLGYKGDHAVATSMLYISNGVAGIYCVSTTAPHRGNGIGQAVTLAPMYDGHQMGCRMCVLQATPMGEPVYRKIGFKRYCSMGKFCLLQEPR